MQKLKELTKQTKIDPMPVGHTARVADCFADRKGICRVNPGEGDDRYEGLPSQESVFAASARGGVSTPHWPPELYFGDFPNYGVKDVVDGWAGAVDTRTGKPIPPPALLAEMKKPSWTRVLRADARCLRCKAGYEGSRAPNLIAGTTTQTGRFLRAMLGPNGGKYVSTLGVRTTPKEYAKVCKTCEPGRYNPRPGGSCRRCRAGTFSMGTRHSSIPRFYATSAPMRCWACLKGFFCPFLGKTHFSVCDASKYGNMCPCPLNHYQDERGASSCKPCPPDYATAQVGSTSLGDCKRGGVPPGHRFKGPHSKDCVYIGGKKPPCMTAVKCEPGSFSTYTRLWGPASVICNTCGPGRYAPKRGSTYCFPCPLGRYTNASGAVECKSCQCSLCGNGANVNVLVNSEKTTCTQAPVNQFSVTYDADGFTKCEDADCLAPFRPLDQNECSAAVGLTAQDKRQRATLCMAKLNRKKTLIGGQKILISTTNATTSPSPHRSASDPNQMDIFSGTVIAISLPIIMVSFFVAALPPQPSPKGAATSE